MVAARRASRPGTTARKLVMALGLVVLLTSCLGGADLAPKAGPATGSTTALLSDVRLASHTEEDGFDRVVFEFTNHLPAWDVRYVDKPVYSDPRGEPVPLAGAYALRVRMAPASGIDFANPAGPVQVYVGPLRLNTGTPQVTEVVQLGDFEGVLSWAIGTRDQVPFRVLTLTDPPRLVVDVAHA